MTSVAASTTAKNAERLIPVCDAGRNPYARNVACARLPSSIFRYAAAAARCLLAVTTAIPYATFGRAQTGSRRTVTLPGTVRASVA